MNSLARGESFPYARCHGSRRVLPGGRDLIDGMQVDFSVYFMSVTSDKSTSSRMVLLFWIGLLVCIGFLGLNVVFDLVDLTWFL